MRSWRRTSTIIRGRLSSAIPGLPPGAAREFTCARLNDKDYDGGCPREFMMPWVTIKTGLTAPDGQEEKLTEYLCDYSGCSNPATHMLGCIVELRVMAAVCDEHVPKPQAPG